MSFEKWLTFKDNVFTYFAIQLKEPNWAGKDILDFGGNIGNILLDSNCTIEEERYWCIDVIKAAIEKGRQTTPKAHFIHYNRYSFGFNPKGIKNLEIPQLDQRFDLILSYSVITHTKHLELNEIVNHLRSLLKDNGKLAFTFMDHNHVSRPQFYKGNNLQSRIERYKPCENVDALLKKASTANWCTLVDETQLYTNHEDFHLSEEDQLKRYEVFYTVDYMQSLFPTATILPPVNAESQHCCIIGPH